MFSLALVLGQAPQRQWLIYAYAPREDRRQVRLTIPNARDVLVDATVGGAFYLVDEPTGNTRRIETP